MVKVDVEYCGTCGHDVKYEEMREVILRRVPETKVSGHKGRQGSFEVEIEKQLVYSKLKTMAFPDFDEVADIVEQVAEGHPVRPVTKEQAITCCVM